MFKRWAYTPFFQKCKLYCFEDLCSSDIASLFFTLPWIPTLSSKQNGRLPVIYLRRVLRICKFAFFKLGPGHILFVLSCFFSVNLITTATASTFKGILMQVRNSSNIAVGTFTIPNDNFKHVFCSNAEGQSSTITHSNSRDKTTTQYQWTPPTPCNGDYTIR